MVKAFVFGLTIAIAVGPIAILIINRGINTGWRSGVMSGVGAALADFTYGIVAFTAGTFLVSFLDLNQQLFAYITSLVLFLFGAGMLKGSIKVVQAERLNPGETKKTNYLLSTYLLTIINPLTIILFLGFSGQLVSPATGMLNIIALAAAIFTGSLIIQLAFASFGATLGRFVRNPATIRLLNIVSSILIMGLGVAGIM